MHVLAQMADAPYGGREPSAAWYVALAKAMRAAYADRLTNLGEAEPKAAESCTTHLTVCDAEGTMVAMTTTLLSSMGSRVVLPGSGVLLNNGMMWFDPSPGTPNSVAPGKRPLTQHAAGDAGRGRQARPGLRRLGRPAHHGGGVPAADLRRRFRHGRDDRRASSAHRRLRPRHGERRPQAAGRGAGRAAAYGPTEVVEHSAVPINFACPNVIVAGADGTRSGISDAASPWSAAVAQG